MARPIEECMDTFVSSVYEMIGEARVLQKRKAEVRECLEYESSSEEYSLTEVVDDLRCALEDALKQVDELVDGLF